jgi:hypothetical protein
MALQQITARYQRNLLLLFVAGMASTLAFLRQRSSLWLFFAANNSEISQTCRTVCGAHVKSPGLALA